MFDVKELDHRIRKEWYKRQFELERELTRQLGTDINPETLRQNNYPANLVSHAVVAQEMLAGSNLNGRQVLEVGFGNRPHLPIIKQYGADCLGFEIDPYSIQCLTELGIAAILGDASSIDTLLPQGYCPDMITGMKFFDYATFAMGADSKIIPADSVLHTLKKTFQLLFTEKYLSNEAAYKKAQTALENYSKYQNHTQYMFILQ